jgi:TAG lipase/lysophosphatidylethanolamine acyltransferase
MGSVYVQIIQFSLFLIVVGIKVCFDAVDEICALRNHKYVNYILGPATSETSTETYDDWYERQKELDRRRNVDGWASFPNHPEYDYQDLQDFRDHIAESQRRDDYHHVCSRLRAMMDRDLCRILSDKLYRRSKIRTKRLIHEYVQDMIGCISYVVNWKGTPRNQWSQKHVVLNEVKNRVLGRTSLVLTGGAMLSMIHIGVVKTLLQHDLLPEVISGISTGSLVAAMVGVSTDEELDALVELRGINLNAFAEKDKKTENVSWLDRAWATFQRRGRRYGTTGHIFDVEVIQKFARDNLGDMTFEEAYEKTGRILNITIAISDVYGMPQLLNYITGPYVLIWSAVVASIATSHRMYAPTRLLCKDIDGSIVGYEAPDAVRAQSHSQYLDELRPPLQRLGELFNVNHFVVSQTRPYVFPFLWAQEKTVNTLVVGKAVRLLFNHAMHWLTRPGVFGLPLPFLHRMMLDELVSSSGESWAKLHIIPQIRLRDMLTMFETPTMETLQKWARIGEESAWPYLCQLEIRCRIELEMGRALANVSQESSLLT